MLLDTDDGCRERTRAETPVPSVPGTAFFTAQMLTSTSERHVPAPLKTRALLPSEGLLHTNAPIASYAILESASSSNVSRIQTSEPYGQNPIVGISLSDVALTK